MLLGYKTIESDNMYADALEYKVHGDINLSKIRLLVVKLSVMLWFDSVFIVDVVVVVVVVFYFHLQNRDQKHLKQQFWP